MSREGNLRRRPFKVWDSARNIRKALVVSSLEELIVRGREKLSISDLENVRAVLESDGTQVDDSEYFRSLADNTVFLLLRVGEKWTPARVDVIRAALSSIPKIVCEAISCLDLQDEVPSWKIMENRGRITIVLNWDQRHDFEQMKGRTTLAAPCGSGGSSSLGVSPTGTSTKYPHGIRTTVNKDGKLETVINDFGHRTPSITICREDINGRAQIPCRFLPRQGSSSLESTTNAPIGGVHFHTVDCSQRGIYTASSGRQSPPEPSTCDFHCCALHEEGRKIAAPENKMHKAVATSPIDPSMFDTGVPTARSSTSLLKPTQIHTHHVRFMDTNNHHSSMHHVASSSSSSSHRHHHHHHHPKIIEITKDTQSTSSSSEESEETENMSSCDIKCVKTLLLTDSCNGECVKSNSLSIKDIGVILERLGSKILDVERLDRSCENQNVRWAIKATVVGELNLGVVYNGKYYSISETLEFEFPPPPPPPEDEVEDMRL